MNEKQILEFCETHNITVKQYFIVYATSRRWKGFAREAQVLNKREPWSEEEIIDLVKKGILKSSDDSFHYLSLSVNSEFSFENLNNIEWGEQLWQAYPATFPLGDGGSFIARTTKGHSKDVIIKEYLTKIGNSEAKHKFVMKQLPGYVKLVENGKINGHTIVDFIRNELWDTISGLVEEKELENKFKMSI
jgi:hypothetical protein